MGVLIRGMKLPDNCGACYIGFCKQIDCERYIGFDDYARRRHPGCPLVELSPHDCNDCGRKACGYDPDPGQLTRINCPLWKPKEDE